MARKRRTFNVYSISFLDCMSCGFGAVVLLYMIINHSIEARSDERNEDLISEVTRLEEMIEQGEGYKVRIRNSMKEVEEKIVVTQGLSKRVIETVKVTQVELATLENETLATKEHINQLKTDVKSKEEETRRLEADVEDEGDAARTFVGEGDRQYLTGLRVGGSRILFLVDSSTSMLDDTIVNVIRRRNMPESQQIASPKWQRAIATVDWLSTQIPADGRFQIYTFNTKATPLLPGTDGQWVDTGDGEQLNEAVEALGSLVPKGGTSLENAFGVIGTLEPAPDNIFLITDGLPTQGKSKPLRLTVSGDQRVRHFQKAMEDISPEIPINIILFQMEGDPQAAPNFWRLAQRTGGTLLSPSKDWP